MLRKLVGQTAIYGISGIVAKFINYLLTPYLTNIMGRSVYGDVTLLYSIIPFANVLLTMGLATSYFRYASRCETPGAKKELFTTSWVSVSMLSVCFMLAVWLFSAPLARVFEVSLSCILATGALIMVDNINAIPLAALREERKSVYYTVVNVVNVVVNVALCVFFYSFMPRRFGLPPQAYTPLWVIVANLAASLVSTVMLMPNTIRLLSRTFSPALLRSLWHYSLPLLMAGLFGVSGDFIDRLMLRFMLPDSIAAAQVGIYGAVGRVAALMVIFRQIYTLGAEPFFLQHFEGNGFQRTNAEATKFFTIVGIAIFLGIIYFQDLFALFIGPEFRIGMPVLPLLLLANLFGGLLTNLSFWYKAADKTRIAVYITGIGVLITIAANVIMIPPMGYYGSAWARVLTTVVMVVASYFLCQRHYPVPFDLRRIGLYFLLGGIFYGLSFVTALPGGWWQWSLNFLLLLMFGAIAFRMEFPGRTLASVLGFSRRRSE